MSTQRKLSDVPDFVVERALQAVTPTPATFDVTDPYSADNRLYRVFTISLDIDYEPDYIPVIQCGLKTGKGALSAGHIAAYERDRKYLSEAVFGAFSPSFSAIHLTHTALCWKWVGMATTGSGNADKIRVKTLRNRLERNLRQALREVRPLLAEDRLMEYQPFTLTLTPDPSKRAEIEREISERTFTAGDIHNAPTDEKEEDADQLLLQIAEGKGDLDALMERISTAYRLKNDAKIRIACRLRAEGILNKIRLDDKSLVVVCVAPELVEKSAGKGKTSFARYLLHGVYGYAPRDVYDAQPSRPFDNYTDQRAIFFEEYNPTDANSRYDIMLRITDPNNPLPVLAPARYYDRAVVAKTVVFCTPLTIDQWSAKMAIGGQEQAMILRRIARVYELRPAAPADGVPADPADRANVEWWSYRYNATGTAKEDVNFTGKASEYVQKWKEITDQWNAPKGGE